MISGVLCSSLNHKQKDKDFKRIDLVYITPQVVACATPTESVIPKLHRAKAGTLKGFLRKYHNENWRILCLQEESEMSYDYLKFGNGAQVQRYPIKDHHPPTFIELNRIIDTMHEYISEDPTNVAVIHCKHGKGRTGMVIAAYLIKYHEMNYESATNRFTAKRIRVPIVQGISIVGQLRYLRYLERWCDLNYPEQYLHGNNVKFARIVIENPKADLIELDIMPQSISTNEIRRQYSGVSRWSVSMKPHQHIIQQSPDFTSFTPDILVQFKAYVYKRGNKVPIAAGEISFNTNFEDDQMGGYLITDQVHGYGPKASVLSAFNDDLQGLGTAKFNWSETDGYYGTFLRGFQAFDSIQFVWSSDFEPCLIPSPI